ncbi:MAG: ethyl tert-butyl ether degradation protein EthD [Burkholderiales bacterium PBB4]|nr:MAG: ethyl tert-butyl ether degradation protein EthD [Burkholderiales bacterium PBB4]
MVKIVFCLRRNPAMSTEEFQDYWRNRHASLVAERAASLGILRYVQSHRLQTAAFDYMADERGCHVPPYDGVAELWFGSEKVLTRTKAPPEAALEATRDLIADEARFIDLQNSPIFVAVEHEIL